MSDTIRIVSDPDIPDWIGAAWIPGAPGEPGTLLVTDPDIIAVCH